MRIGGRILHANLDRGEVNPLVIPGRHHVITLLVRHYHKRVKHQDRLFTEGAIRMAGLWIVRGKRCISTMIHKCITCRKLRRRQEEQKMADLPAVRLSTEPPFFTCVEEEEIGTILCAERWCCLSNLLGYFAQSWTGRHSDTGYQHAGTHFADLRKMTGRVNPTWY